MTTKSPGDENEMSEINRIGSDAIRSYSEFKSQATEATGRVNEQSQASLASGSKKTDSVTLSEGGRNVQRLQHLVAQSPDVREDRIAEIRKSLADGAYSYRVDKLSATLLTSGIITGN